jgi:hypothetical protein
MLYHWWLPPAASQSSPLLNSQFRHHGILPRRLVLQRYDPLQSQWKSDIALIISVSGD